MEGRDPPPRATHPYEDNPKYNKFWGTHTAKGFFKFASVGMTLWVALLGINMYLTRNETHRFMGFGRITSYEEKMTRREKLAIDSVFRRNAIPVSLINTDGTKQTNADGTEAESDDRIRFLTNYSLSEQVLKSRQVADPSHVHE